MSRGVKIGLIIGTILLVAGGGIGAAVAKNKHKAVEVRMDTVAHRDLVAAVTASGKIDAEKTVDITADITGRILQIAVKEGDTVRKGQFLVQIDPVQFQGAQTQPTQPDSDTPERNVRTTWARVRTMSRACGRTIRST